MKYLIVFFLAIATSCGPEAKMFDRQYILKNSSSMSLELQFFRQGEISLRFKFAQLLDGEQLEGEVLERSGGPWSELSEDNNISLPATSFETDSVRIIFNNEKFIVHHINYVPLAFSPSVRNILKDTDYTSIGNDKFLFTISESDFDNAEDCNGNCN